MTPMKPLEFVNVEGRRIDPRASSATVGKRVSSAPAEWHNGWAVEGYAPGRIDAAHKAHDAEFAAWAGYTEVEKARRLRDGERAPKPWDEEIWVRDNRLSRVRARPFEIPSSAEQMAEMARKAGWQYVEVVELAKRAGR